jgi:hypothetical protein
VVGRKSKPNILKKINWFFYDTVTRNKVSIH